MLLFIAFACNTPPKEDGNNKQLAELIANNEYLPLVKSMALETMKSGFNAGSGYPEVQNMLHKQLEELRVKYLDSDELTQDYLDSYLSAIGNRNGQGR